MAQVRLHLSNITRDGRYGLLGGADFGAAITAANVKVVDALAAALAGAGYTKATLMLDAEESLMVVAGQSVAVGPPSNILKFDAGRGRD